MLRKLTLPLRLVGRVLALVGLCLVVYPVLTLAQGFMLLITVGPDEIRDCMKRG